MTTPAPNLATACILLLILQLTGRAATQTPPPSPPDNHWSFQPLRTPTVPEVTDPAWPRTPVDHFILAQLATTGANPAGPANKHTLIRRASFDLIGLPPTPEEIDAFVADATPHAFERVIHRLLNSKHYGERWGRHWLDIVRYADTAGDTADYPVPDAWRYRNYVIDAFNADKPYDEFLREQIAGDILAREGPREHYAERVAATGFLAISRRFGFDSENYQHLLRPRGRARPDPDVRPATDAAGGYAHGPLQTAPHAGLYRI